MRTSVFSSLVIACASVAAGQDKITVPLSNPSQPATVRVSLLMGSITVTAGVSSQIVVEAEGRTSHELPPPEVPQGMHRLDLGGPSLDVQEDHNVVTINSGHYSRRGNIAIQVPPNTSLQLKTIAAGRVEVSGVNGAIEVENITGAIVLKNVSGSVVAASQNGSITVALDKVTADKPMAFTSLNGKIDVTLPADTKARLRLKTENGSVYSDFDVKMDPQTGKPQADTNQGMYRLRTDRNVNGSINGGGPEYRFETMNGSILIHKK